LWRSLTNNKGLRAMDSGERKVEEKKPYEAPRVATISLRPEEAVLGHCKTASGGGVQIGCQFFTCSSVGS
jgi:hypothetical protein